MKNDRVHQGTVEAEKANRRPSNPRAVGAAHNPLNHEITMKITNRMTWMSLLAAMLCAGWNATAEPAPESSRAPAASPASHLPPLIARLDTNHDGVVTEDEFAQAGKLFKKMDRNEDGKLTPDEVRQARRHALRNGHGRLAKAFAARAERRERDREEPAATSRHPRGGEGRDTEGVESGPRERRREGARAEWSAPRRERAGGGPESPRVEARNREPEICPECGRPLRGRGPRGPGGTPAEDRPAPRTRNE